MSLNKEPWKVFHVESDVIKLCIVEGKREDGEQVRAVPGAQAREGEDWELMMTMERQRAGQT